MFPPNEHSKLSPSRLSRIIECPGSLEFGRRCEEEEITETRSSYAEEGTMLHAAIEARITGKVWTGPTLDSEQKNAVDDAHDYYENLFMLCASQKGFLLSVERRVYLKAYDSCLFDCDGTADVIMQTDTELHVLDWKFGKGIPVFAEDNDQLYAYAAGAAVNTAGLLGFKKVFIHCIQPRLDSYSVHELAPKQLNTWLRARLIPAVTEALSDNPTFHAGPKQCRWCPGKLKCRVRYDKVSQTAAEVFRTATILTSGVSKEELANLYSKSKELTRYLSDIKEYMTKTLKSGEVWPGYKLVAGRSSRSWKETDTETCLDSLLDYLDWSEIFEQKMITPPKAEKLNRKLKKDEDFQALIRKSEGAPTLVPESDKRPPLEFRTAAEIFKEAEQS